MIIKKTAFLLLVVGFALLLAGASLQSLPTQVLAQEPEVASGDITIPYPGQLSNNAGDSVTDGTYALSFSLYAENRGGEALWSEVHRNVAVIDGAFVVTLGSVRALPQSVLDAPDIWLEVGVRARGESDFTMLSPRQRVNATTPAALSNPAAGATCAHDHVGEVWRASIPWGNGAFKVENNRNGPSIWGVNTGGGNAVRGDGYGTSIGVYGEGADGPGVAGRSEGGHGTEGWSNNGDAGVYGHGSWAVGVWGHSEHLAGVLAHSVDGVAISATSESGDIIRTFGASGSPDIEFKVTNDGNVYADGSFHPGGADFAEMLPAVSGLTPGDVLVIAPDGKLSMAVTAFDQAVVGVYSTRPGFVGGAGDDVDLTGQVPLAIVGIVPVKASAENGAIRPGDLLVTSSTAGHVMRGGTHPPQGTVVGKALQGLDESTDVIKILVTLQ